MGNIRRRAQAPQRDLRKKILLAGLTVRVPLTLRVRIRPNKAGRNVVHGDTPRPEFVRELPSQSNLSRLRRRIGLDACLTYSQARTAGDVHDPSAPGFLHVWRNCL